MFNKSLLKEDMVIEMGSVGNPGFLRLFSVLPSHLTVKTPGQFQACLGQWTTMMLWFIMDISLLFSPFSGTVLLKPWEFPRC